LLNGDIARHGMAVMIAREELGFETNIESDTAPLAGPVQRLLSAGIDIHCMRDLTRGGLASAVVEIAETSGAGITLDEASIPVRPSVAAACELLGFDPIHVANEGRFIAFVSADDAAAALAILRQDPSCSEAVLIGHVTETPSARVTMTSRIGGVRMVDMLSGEQLPRIC
jgi:hydrogenase expression/formation protein HypE